MISFDKVLSETTTRLSDYHGRKGHISEGWSNQEFEEWVQLFALSDYADRNVKGFTRRAKALEKDMRSMLAVLDEKNVSEFTDIDSAMRQNRMSSTLQKLTTMRKVLDNLIATTIDVKNRV